MIGLHLALAFLTIIMNGMFVGIEFALISARRTSMEVRAEQGDRRAKAVIACQQNLPESLGGAQIGITITSLILGYLGEPAVAHLLEDLFHSLGVPKSLEHTLAFIIALFIVVFLHMVLGEMVPKNFSLSRAEETALLLARPHRAFLWLFRPVIWLLNAMANAGLRLFNVEPVDELGTAVTAQEFSALVDASRGEGYIGDFEHYLLSGVLVFRDRKVAEVLVPWADTVSVPRNATVAEFTEVAATSGHSRLPIVAEPGSSEIVGFVHVKDLLYLPDDAQDWPPPRTVIRRMVAVDASGSLENLLFSMQRAQIHFGVVRVPGPGGRPVTHGIVTLEDVLEALVGDIIDESDVVSRSS